MRDASLGPAAARARPRAAPALPASLRLWHWLLTPGWMRQTPAARLRGWARVLDWRDATARRRLVLVRRAVWTLVRAWKEARADVARFGAEVHAAAGVTPAEQRRQLWWLAVRHGLTAESYIDYGLYRPEARRRAGEYVEQREHARIVWWLLRHRRADDAGAAFPGRDKTRFEAWCRAHGLATVPVLVELERGAVVRTSLAEPAHYWTTAALAPLLPRRDLFAKPSDGQYGTDSLPWLYDPATDAWTGRDGRARTALQLLDEIAALSASLPVRHEGIPNRVLLQPRLRNHEALRPVAPRALSTARILTARAPDGPGQVVFAAFRMAVGDAPADNFHFGGIIAPVDLESGRLGAAQRRRTFVLDPVDRHPDTGAPIAGRRLPLWAEAKALALRAFAAAPERVTVGWDVAITESGPLLVEGNTASHPDIAQATMRAPLGDTPYPTLLDAHVRRTLVG